MKFGAITDNVATIYAMSTNNGIEAFTFTLTGPVENADFDGDTTIGAGDLAIWGGGFGTEGGATSGDANGDGTVDGGDFLIWQQQFNEAPPVAGAVPEPTAGLMALSALAGLAGRRRRG